MADTYFDIDWPDFSKLNSLKKEVAKERQDKIARLKPDIPIIRPEMIERDNAVRVSQKEIGVTQADRPHPYLSTFGAWQCVIVTMYDPHTRIGSLGHFDATTDIFDATQTMLHALGLEGDDRSRAEAAVIGGKEGSSEELIITILDSLEKNLVPIVERDVLNDKKAIIMNTATGKRFKMLAENPDVGYKGSKLDRNVANYGKASLIKDPDGLIIL